MIASLTRGRLPVAPLILLAVDSVAIVATLEITALLRVVANPFFAKQFSLVEAGRHLPPVAATLVVWLLAFLATGLYRAGWDTPGGSILDVARGILVGTAGLVVLTFLFHVEPLARSLLFFSAIIGVPVVAGARKAAAPLVEAIGDAHGRRENMAIVGFGLPPRLLREHRASPGGATLVGFISEAEEYPVGDGGPVLGSVAHLRDLINLHDLHRVIVATRHLDSKAMLQILEVCDQMDVRLSIAPDIFGLLWGEVRLSAAGGVPLIDVKPVRLSRWDQALKRAFDVVASVGGGLLVAPLCLATAAAIRITSPGPVFHVQKRVGHGGRHFRFYKFRSMVAEAERLREDVAALNQGEGPLFKIRHDPRVTPVGRVLRRFSLDEMPQLLNVLRGQMSLVGPRPLPVREVEEARLVPEYGFWLTKRAEVAPGMTGLWQVRGRSDLPFDQMVHLDLLYIERWSLWLDVRILLRTLGAVMRGAGAY